MSNGFKMQLFLLHFAGGSCYSFDFLRSYLSSDFEFIPLELPGRGKRFNEDQLSSKEEAIQDYLEQIKSLRSDRPYLIFGHSMGATLGLSVVREMELLGDAPYVFVVSGNSGPGLNHFNDTITVDLRKRHLMNDSDFKNELLKLGGLPEEMLQDEELYEFFSPIIRADFSILERSDFSEKGMCINTPIYAFMGDQEETVEGIENWRNFTSADFKYKIFQGDHFFIYNNSQKLSDSIKNIGSYTNPHSISKGV